MAVGPVAAAGAAPPDPRHTAAEKSAREFESVFAGQMAKLMLDSVEVDDSFGGGHGEEMFRGVLAERLGEEIARGGGLGIAPAVLQVLLRMQGEEK